MTTGQVVSRRRILRDGVEMKFIVVILHHTGQDTGLRRYIN